MTSRIHIRGDKASATAGQARSDEPRDAPKEPTGNNRYTRRRCTTDFASFDFAQDEDKPFIGLRKFLILSVVEGRTTEIQQNE
jgi:hypothetical protein